MRKAGKKDRQTAENLDFYSVDPTVQWKGPMLAVKMGNRLVCKLVKSRVDLLVKSRVDLMVDMKDD